MKYIFAVMIAFAVTSAHAGWFGDHGFKIDAFTSHTKGNHHGSNIDWSSCTKVDDEQTLNHYFHHGDKHHYKHLLDMGVYICHVKGKTILTDSNHKEIKRGDYWKHNHPGGDQGSTGGDSDHGSHGNNHCNSRSDCVEAPTPGSGSLLMIGVLALLFSRCKINNRKSK